MGSPFETRAFKALQAEWEAKLAASGLQDVERKDGTLVYGGSALRRGARRAARAHRSEYYRRAGQWLWERTWRTRTQRRTWELHAEGYTHREIMRALGPMRMRQERRVLETIIRERGLMTQPVVGLRIEEVPSLHAQHLQAEGFGDGYGFDHDGDPTGPGDPMRRIMRNASRALHPADGGLGRMALGLVRNGYSRFS